ncbi:hypothetical protein [Sulfitobacter sp. 915]|uniref:hypothetical protein n=1 Tax=Sulfitobacter sp. 915 TaxID=3368558 RepID=UPI0037467FD0
MSDDSDDKPDDENGGVNRPKGFDISELEVEMSEEERAAADERLWEQFKEVSEGSAVIADALRGIGGIGALQAAMASVNSFQDAINSVELDGLQEAVLAQARVQDQFRDATGGLATSGIQDHLSGLTGAGVDRFMAEHAAMEEARKVALGGLPEGYMDHLLDAQTAASRLMETMRENHRLMFQHVDMFADMRRSIEAATSFDLNSVIIPRMDFFNEALGIDRIGSALAAADAASVLGFHPAFNDEILTATSLISEQFSAFSVAQEAASAALRLGLPKRLEEILARSIAAQEALVDEYREAAKDAKVEAAFHRRNATISMIINILMLLLALTLQIEERLTDPDESVRSNTEAVRELQQSFDGMAAQMQRMNDLQESASAEEQAADAAIADLLREIADSLEDQDPEEAELSAESQRSGLSKPPAVE